MKNQPIAAPSDVKRYFVTPEESGKLCMMSAILGKNRNIFFPKLDSELHMIDFKSVAERFLESRGLMPYQCENEEEARAQVEDLRRQNKWPCYFSESNTTGEKQYEEFFTPEEEVDIDTYKEIGKVVNATEKIDSVNRYLKELNEKIESGSWSKKELVELVSTMVPNLDHDEKDFYLDNKM